MYDAQEDAVTQRWNVSLSFLIVGSLLLISVFTGRSRGYARDDSGAQGFLD